MSASLRRNGRAFVIAEHLACASAGDALCLRPTFIRAQLAGIVTDELASAQLAMAAPDVLRIDIPDRLNRIQAIEHKRPSFLGRQEITKYRFPWVVKHGS